MAHVVGIRKEDKNESESEGDNALLLLDSYGLGLCSCPGEQGQWTIVYSCIHQHCGLHCIFFKK